MFVSHQLHLCRLCLARSHRYLPSGGGDFIHSVLQILRVMSRPPRCLDGSYVSERNLQEFATRTMNVDSPE